MTMRKKKKKEESGQPSVDEPKEKKIDGRTKEGRLQKINSEITELTRQRDVLLNECSSVSVKLNRLLEHIKLLQVLLSAFNAIIYKGEVKLEKPVKGSSYWYIRAMSSRKSFEVVACQWYDCTSDHFRYCKGNMFLDESICNSACAAMNEMLREL